MITIDQFIKLFPSAKDPQVWVDALGTQMQRFQIIGDKRQSQFLAQCAHESCGFTALHENLNYRAEALTATWPKRFPADIAGQYAHQPEKIANRAYAGKIGNGDEESGDGWKYRGRGIIQITGHDNYAAVAKAIGKTIDETVAYLETIEGAVVSACWFWTANGLNILADTDSFERITKRINGGTNGLADRKARLAQIEKVMAVA